MASKRQESILFHSVNRSFRGEKEELGDVNYQRNNTRENPRGNKYKLSDCKFPLTIQYTEFFFISWRLTILQHCSGSCHTLT